MSESELKLAKRAIERYQNDPPAFCEDILGVDWWSKQKEIALSVCNQPRTAVKACHSSGKTKAAADIGIWFLSTHFPSILLTTAPTNRQVAELLWREMRLDFNQAKIPLSGRFYEISKWNLGDNWYGLGLATKDPNAFQGHHSENILVIVDEAAGVPEQIFDVVEGILSTENAKLLLIGNPTSMSGSFHAAFHGRRADFNCISISALDTPNFTGESSRPYLVTPTWLQDIRRNYGEDSPFYQARALGDFPKEGLDTLIPLRLIEEAQEGWFEAEEGEPCEIGIDVARFGTNETVLAVRKGAKVIEIQGLRKRDTMEVAGLAIQLLRQHRAERIKIDAVGLGAGVYDRLLEQGFPVIAIESGAGARESEKYSNVRAELWDGLLTRFRSGDIFLPPDQVLSAQLSSVKYSYNSRGQLVIESKEAMMKRGLASPDRADAVVYVFASYGGTPLAEVGEISQRSKWTSRLEEGSRWRR